MKKYAAPTTDIETLLWEDAFCNPSAGEHFNDPTPYDDGWGEDD